MSKTFRAWHVDQVWLLPPSVHDFVPAGHPAHLVRELVRGELDLAAIMAVYDEERPAAVRSGDDGGAAAVRLRRPLRLAADRQSLRGAARLHGVTGAAARLPHHQRLQQAPSGGARRGCSCRCCGCAARPGWSSSGTSRSTAPSSRPTPPAQGDELRAHAPGRGRAHGRGRGWLAGRRRPMPPRMPSMARTAATSCPSGWPTSRRGCERSARPRRRWRPRPGPIRRRRTPRPVRLGHERPRPAATAPRRRAAGAGAAQLHRSREPHPEDQRRLHPGLQRPARGRCRRSRSSWPSA